MPDSGETGASERLGRGGRARPGVRVPHQNRSRPSTSSTRASRAAPPRPRRGGGRGTDTARSATRRGPARARRPRRGRSRGSGRPPTRTGSSSPGGRAPTRRRCRTAGSSTVGATRTRSRSRAPAAPAGAATSGATASDRARERVDRRTHVGHGAGRHRMERDAGGGEHVGVLTAVLLVVDDDEVGRERDDRRDVRVLGATDRRDARLLAEPRARDRGPRRARAATRWRRERARRRGRVGGRHGAPLHPVEQLGLLRLELLGRDRALVAQGHELRDLVGDVRRRRRGTRVGSGSRDCWRSASACQVAWRRLFTSIWR